MIILENTVARGADCVQQVRRRYINIEQENGLEVVRIKGNIHKKNMQGRAANYKPLDVVVHGEAEVVTISQFCFNILSFQVEIIKKLLHHLPSVGCKYCSNADPPQRLAVHPRCVCDDLFLQPLPKLRPSDKTLFSRERRGNNWHQDVMKTVSEEAKLSQVYTNGSLRPTVVTELLNAGYTDRQVMEFTGHKSSAMVQKYNRQLEMMNSVEKRQANMLLNSSGRNALRGGVNKFGEVGQSDGASKKIGRNHLFAVQGGAGLASIAKVNLKQILFGKFESEIY